MLDKRKFYINGEWVVPNSKQTMPVINPATEKQIGTVTLGNNDDVDLSNFFICLEYVSAQIIKLPLPSASGESSGPDLNLDPDPGQNQQKPTNPSINSAAMYKCGNGWAKTTCVIAR